MEVNRNDALLVVDVQNDFCPGGTLAVAGGDEIVPSILRLSRSFDHILLTQDWHPPHHASFASSHPGHQPFEVIETFYGQQRLWPDHCVQGTRGAEFHPRLTLPKAELVLRKGFRRAIDSYSAFVENDRITPTGLTGYLRERGLTRLVLAGLATDYCVRYSALDARRNGFEAIVVEDACRPIAGGQDYAGVMDDLRQAGVVVVRETDISVPG
ncbi:MAG: bifunctional nicotinamidase/pyrazinamidase [Magnetospirillum sp.]|nr:MAG: bifunctional nicotinamidase/pyrazinamidase [Magnetospirillum sp.]